MGVVQFAHTDYTRDVLCRWQWTFSNSNAGILVQLLGILVTVALAQLWILFQSIYVAKVRYGHSGGRSSPTAAGTNQNLRTLWEFIIDVLQQLYREISPPVQLPGAPPQKRWKVVLGKSFVICFSFLIFVGILALGALANTLQGDNKVLTKYATCGAYYLPLNVTDRYASESLFETRAQRDSQRYARLCYGDLTPVYGCDQFKQQEIKYSTISGADCPWTGGMCHLGGKGAISFHTGPTPAFALGINAKPSLQFERSTTCAPVMMNSTTVTHWTKDDEGYTVDIFDYHYGESSLLGRKGVSWDTMRPRSDLGQSAVYQVSATAQEYGPNGLLDGPYTAMPDMSPPNGTILTLVFIQPGRIFYTSPSNDPIFPADHHFTLGGFDFWEYQDRYARVLGCVDRARWRDLAEGPEWHERTQHPTEPPENVDGNKWMLFLAMQHSNIYMTTSRAADLNASSLLYTQSSSPVAPNQWEIEAKQFFETSLARLQFETSYIARGTYADYPGWVKTSPNIVSPKMCRHNYLTNDPKYTNINGLVYLSILLPCLLIIMLSCPWNEALLWEHMLGRERAEKWAHVMVSALETCGKWIRSLTAWIFIESLWLLGKTITAIRHMASIAWRFSRRQQLLFRTRWC